MFGDDISEDEVDLLDASLVRENDPVLGGKWGQHKQVGEERFDVTLDNKENSECVFSILKILLLVRALCILLLWVCLSGGGIYQEATFATKKTFLLFTKFSINQILSIYEFIF